MKKKIVKLNLVLQNHLHIDQVNNLNLINQVNNNLNLILINQMNLNLIDQVNNLKVNPNLINHRLLTIIVILLLNQCYLHNKNLPPCLNNIQKINLVLIWLVLIKTLVSRRRVCLSFLKGPVAEGLGRGDSTE